MLKILCIHGANQSAEIMEQRMKPILRKMKNDASFIFIESPFPVNDATDNNKKQWWYKTQDKETKMWKYDTGKEGVEFIEKFIQTQGPFNACIAFSQGVSALQVVSSELLNNNFTHMVLVGGYTLSNVSDLKIQHEYNGKILFVAGTADEIVPQSKTVELSEKYTKASYIDLFVHPKRHEIPINAEFVNHLKSFLKG